MNLALREIRRVSFFTFQNEKNETDGDERHRNEERTKLEAVHAASRASTRLSSSAARVSAALICEALS